MGWGRIWGIRKKTDAEVNVEGSGEENFEGDVI